MLKYWPILLLALFACRRHRDTIYLTGREAAVEVKAKTPTDEGAAPETYLLVKATAKDKNWGQKQFVGSITNYAREVAFQDVQITLHFMNNACKEIGGHTVATRDPIAPGQKLGFQIKVFVPDSTAEVFFTAKGQEAL